MKDLHINFDEIETLDMHTGGEPLRIVMKGFPTLSSNSILGMRREMQSKYDHLRKVLMYEPRGHADMYGLIKTRPERIDSAFGVLFMHNAGYSTMCGHATIAIGKAAVELGWVEVTEPITRFCIDAPCGQLTLYVKVENGVVIDVAFDNVPSFYLGEYELISPQYGNLIYDLAYGGAFYAYIDVRSLGLTCMALDYQDLIRAGRSIKKQIMNEGPPIVHPYAEDLNFLYGVIFIDSSSDPGIHSRNVCVFADGEVDRCSTGSGISGRAAIYFAKNELAIGQRISVQSITGSVLDVEVRELTRYGPHEAVIPRVSGRAYFTGRHHFWVDPSDPMRNGFLLR